MNQAERTAAAAMLDWWLEAGVDVAVSEASRNWLRAPVAAVPAAALVADPRPPAEDLGAFRHWLENEPGLPLDRPGARRVLPHGAEAAEVMLLSDQPGGDDGDRPIGGEAWALTAKMLAAIGIAPEAAYSGSLACFAAPGARLTRDELETCATIARRHVALARPKRLILLGEGPALALLGERLPQARGHIHKVEGVRTIATFHPRWLLQRPGDKALAWRDLLLLMEEEK